MWLKTKSSFNFVAEHMWNFTKIFWMIYSKQYILFYFNTFLVNQKHREKLRPICTAGTHLAVDVVCGQRVDCGIASAGRQHSYIVTSHKRALWRHFEWLSLPRFYGLERCSSASVTVVNYPARCMAFSPVIEYANLHDLIWFYSLGYLLIYPPQIATVMEPISFSSKYSPVSHTKSLGEYREWNMVFQGNIRYRLKAS